MADNDNPVENTHITPDLINRFLAVAEEMLRKEDLQPREIAGAMIVALDRFSEIAMKDTMTQPERHEELVFMLNNIREMGSIH